MRAPVRFYTLKLSPTVQGFQTFSVDSVTVMDGSSSTPGLQAWRPFSVDPEGIAFDPRRNQIYWSNEGTFFRGLKLIKWKKITHNKPCMRVERA